MAIGAIYRGTGFTQEQYDRVHQQVTPDNRPPPGLLYHTAGTGQDGFCLIEVWESQEALQAFFAAKLGRALQEAKVEVTPVFFAVTNTMQP